MFIFLNTIASTNLFNTNNIGFIIMGLQMFRFFRERGWGEGRENEFI